MKRSACFFVRLKRAIRCTPGSSSASGDERNDYQPKYRGLTRKSGTKMVWTGKVFLDDAALSAPKRWRNSRLVFVNSMSDLFHESVPEDFIENVWRVMASTPQHTYQILTKRASRACDIISRRFSIALPNVWIGVSVESSETLYRLDHLRDTPAAVRFVSFEPLLGSVCNADLRYVDWAIVGGESGPKAREMQEIWVSEIEDLCRTYKTAFFFKQWGAE